jgi:flagellar biosynthesis chaperone FliJ
MTPEGVRWGGFKSAPKSSENKRMKKFNFRLERVFRYHQQRLKQAELRLAQAAMERNNADNAVRHWLGQIERACQLNETVGGLINPAIRANMTAHLDQLAANLAAARERLKVSEQRFREQERVRAEITQDVEGFTKLRDLRRQEHRDDVIHQQQIELDEVVMRRWSKQGADDSLLTPEMSE